MKYFSSSLCLVMTVFGFASCDSGRSKAQLRQSSAQVSNLETGVVQLTEELDKKQAELLQARRTAAEAETIASKTGNSVELAAKRDQLTSLVQSVEKQTSDLVAKQKEYQRKLLK